MIVNLGRCKIMWILKNQTMSEAYISKWIAGSKRLKFQIVFTTIDFMVDEYINAWIIR